MQYRTGEIGSLAARTRWVPERGLAPILTELTWAVDASARLLVFLDYDGTLTPIVNDPRDAWMPREVQALLSRLIRYSRVRVGVISGRALDDLRERVGLTGVIRAGCHGLEIEGDGLAFVHPLAAAYQEAVRTAGRALRLHVGSIPGIQIESKGLTLALHWRNAEPSAMPRVSAAIERVRRLNRLRLLSGKQAAEIIPDVGWTKGESVLWIRDHVFAGGPVEDVVTLYVGDDSTDELAFAKLAAQAITVRVGEQPHTAAAYRLAGVGDVHRLLAALARELENRWPLSGS